MRDGGRHTSTDGYLVAQQPGADAVGSSLLERSEELEGLSEGFSRLEQLVAHGVLVDDGGGCLILLGSLLGSYGKENSQTRCGGWTGLGLTLLPLVLARQFQRLLLLGLLLELSLGLLLGGSISSTVGEGDGEDGGTVVVHSQVDLSRVRQSREGPHK
jgi:hypothetical protein